MAVAPTSEELVTLFREGMLVSGMARRFGLNDRVEIQLVQARCAALHNAGTLDLLRLVENGTLQTLCGSEFFMATHFFCQILPELEATPARMMSCVEALVIRGGEDGAANQPNAAFRTWCGKDHRRASEVIAAARDGDSLATRHLTFALEAMSASAVARNIALGNDDDRRLSAITALGRIVDDDLISRDETLSVFGELLDGGADDRLRASVLHAIAAILERNRDVPCPQGADLVRRLVENAGELIMHQAARMLWAYPIALQPDIVTHLLEALTCLDPAKRGTVNELDLGLQSLLEIGYDEAAIGYVTQQLSGPHRGLKLSDLPSFAKALLAGPTERLSHVVAQWLQLGEPRLCDGLATALQRYDLDELKLNIRADDLAISPAGQVFVCRKAIGWFFFQPTTAASVLVSVLRVCDEQTALEVQNLLVEPLLLNYGGVRRFLEALAPDDVAKGRADLALAQNEAYLADLQLVPLIKELQPSERHRRIERLRMSDQMSDAHKHAQSESVLLSLMKHSVLLYGNRSLSFLKNGKDELQPLETDLQSFGVSFEMPRMEIVDPVGLDFILRVFRAERMTS